MTKVTKYRIEQKINRKRNPVQNMAQLAQEFGYDTTLTNGHSTAAPAHFRRRVKSLVGEKTYRQIRDDRFVNKSYR